MAQIYCQQSARQPGDIISERRATSSRNRRVTSSESAFKIVRVLSKRPMVGNCVAPSRFNFLLGPNKFPGNTLGIRHWNAATGTRRLVGDLFEVYQRRRAQGHRRAPAGLAGIASECRSVGARLRTRPVGCTGDRGERRGGGRVFCDIWSGEGEAIILDATRPTACSGAPFSSLGHPDPS